MKHLTLLLVFISVETAGWSQNKDTLRFSSLQFYLSSQVAIPSATFREVINNSFGNLGYGISTGILFSPLGQKKPSPVLLGIDFGYFNYGIEKKEATVTTPPLKTTYNVFTWNGITRLRPKNYHGRLTPFLDGLLGFKLFNTKTKIDKNLLNVVVNDNQPEMINNVKDTGVNYGLGAGFMTNPKKVNGVGFSLRVLYLWGDNVKYVVRNSLSIDANKNVTFQTAEAKTSMVIIQLGFSAAKVFRLVNAK